jgi:hypothetical protein
MRHLIIANIESLEASRFLVADFYDDFGYLKDQIIVPFENMQQAIEQIKELAQEYGQTVDLWTSDKELFAYTLNVPGLNGVIKHPDDVSTTKSAIHQFEEILRESYEIEPLIPLPKLPGWRRRLFYFVFKIANMIGGNGKYEI